MILRPGWSRPSLVTLALLFMAVLPGQRGEAQAVSSSGVAIDFCEKRLTITKAGDGDGLVGSSPGGIGCGPSCTASFLFLSQVTLTATPSPPSSFTSWGGACTGTAPTCTVTMDRAQSVTATFSRPCITVGPSLSLPSDRQVVGSLSVSFSWQTAAEASFYDLVLDTNPSPSTIRVSNLVQPLLENNVSCSVANLQPRTTYYWKVVARKAGACPGVSSAVWSFSTPDVCEAPKGLQLDAPADAATGVSKPAQLSWTAATDASRYYLFFGTTNPPAYLDSTTATSYAVPNVVGGGLYYWQVAAVAGCDSTKTSTSPVRSFRLGGACVAPESFQLATPAQGEFVEPQGVLLGWQESKNASSYDLYFGVLQSPPLFQSGITQERFLLPPLEPGLTYYWKVVATSSCDTRLSYASAVQSFRVTPKCSGPKTVPEFTFDPPGELAAGQTYVLAWLSVDGGAGSGYVVERSTSQDFSTILDSQSVSTNFTTFVAPSPGSYYHRVRAVAGCDPALQSANSRSLKVTVGNSRPAVVFSVTPKPVVIRLGDKPENYKTSFTLENITDKPIAMSLVHTVLLGQTERVFFAIADPLPEGPVITLKPGEPRSFDIRFYPMESSLPQSLEALIFTDARDLSNRLPVVPYSYVNLKIGAEVSETAPVFLFGNRQTDVVFFPGVTGSDVGRPPLSVTLKNPGSTPMDLAAEIGPDVWLRVGPGWNSTPLAAGETRTLNLFTDRASEPESSPYPRYTYLTVKSRTGLSARLLVQDNKAPETGELRKALDGSVRTSIIPYVVGGAQSGDSHASRVKLGNLGSSSLRADLYFTPSGSDGGNPASVRTAAVEVPPNSLVNLTDPLTQLFLLAGEARGNLEVRVPPERTGSLAVSSDIERPAARGGSTGFSVPVVARGAGIRAGALASLGPIRTVGPFESRVILTETTGVDGANVKLTLWNPDGERLGETERPVPRYGTVIVDVRDAFGSENRILGGRLDLEVLHGLGTVTGLALDVDTSTGLQSAHSARIPRAGGQPSGSKRGGRASSRFETYVIPSIVSGLLKHTGAATSPRSHLFVSELTFENPNSTDVRFSLRLLDSGAGAGDAVTRQQSISVSPRQSVRRTLSELFGTNPAAPMQGPLFIDVEGGGILRGTVFTGTDGSATELPLINASSEFLTGKKSARVLFFDGLEQSLFEISPNVWSEAVRGTRWNLTLTEVEGRAVTVRVSLRDNNNPNLPLRSRELTLKPYERRQLATVFRELEMNENVRRKERTNVRCIVEYLSGDGMVAAMTTKIDNSTGQSTNYILAPGAPLDGGGCPICF
ncbi:MAG: hypothetical protein IT186_13525 [Acidobacteria bacterium]|nr:hypothetical protein [Acidobacteriota bacterium]